MDTKRTMFAAEPFEPALTGLHVSVVTTVSVAYPKII